MHRFWSLIPAVVGLLTAMPAQAQSPAPNWTGFYLGGQFGGGWGSRSVDYKANDPAFPAILNGTIFADSQPAPPHSFTSSGVTGGITFGYNWQISPRWVAGFEADFSAANISGSGSNSFLLTAGPYIQSLNSEQKVDWWGTVRARLGWLATNDVMLFGTAGLAYGHVRSSDYYVTTGPTGGAYSSTLGGFSVRCDIYATCASGENSEWRAGWTAGGGGEWRWSRHWSLKLEYLYVNLGSASAVSTAFATNIAGRTLASYTANFGRTDFHVVRGGLNFHF